MFNQLILRLIIGWEKDRERVKGRGIKRKKVKGIEREKR